MKWLTGISQLVSVVGLGAVVIVLVFSAILSLTGTWSWDGETKTLLWEEDCEPVWITINGSPGAKPIDIRCGEDAE